VARAGLAQEISRGIHPQSCPNAAWPRLSTLWPGDCRSPSR